MRLGVVRPVSSDPTTDCQFIVVGITSLTNGRYYNKLNLVALNETISVQAGDYIAMTYANDEARLPYVFAYSILSKVIGDFKFANIWQYGAIYLNSTLIITHSGMWFARQINLVENYLKSCVIY